MDENTNLMDILLEDEEQNNEEQEQSDGFSKVGWDNTEDDRTTYSELFDENGILNNSKQSLNAMKLRLRWMFRIVIH